MSTNKINIENSIEDHSFDYLMEEAFLESDVPLCLNSLDEVIVNLFECDFCSKIFNDSVDLNNHKMIHKYKYFICDRCQKHFARKSEFIFHIKTHSTIALFSCIICNKYFDNNLEMIEHKSKHTSKKILECDICFGYFTDLSTLANHQKNSHTGEKPFVCEFCQQGFIAFKSIIEHKKCHTGTKPYKCTFCSQLFSNSSILADHLKIHTGEMLDFPCTFCQRSFSSLLDLMNHVAIHKKCKRSVDYELLITKVNDITEVIDNFVNIIFNEKP